MPPTDAEIDSLRDQITRQSGSEVHTDRGTRMLYATDASLYQIAPLGVALPRTVRDAATAVRLANDAGVSIVPRGGATSLSGQTIGEGLVLDFSKYVNRVGIVDRDRRVVHVEPGLVLDRFNAHLKPLGLMFGPDVSTSDRATLGGMIGNNSAGARSLRYGKVVDHIHSVDVILADGSTATFGPVEPQELDALCRREDRIGFIYRTVRDTVSRHEHAIRSHFPRILRRVSGYNLDEFLPGFPIRPVDWPDEPWKFNLARLIVGSEGTLAVTVGAAVKVVPVPPAQGLVVLSFASIPAALERLDEILQTGPVAVEMLDRLILDLAAGNPEMARHLEFADGHPAAVLAAQYYADSAEELVKRADDLTQRFEGRPGVLGIRQSLTASAKDDFWKVRKAGLSLLMGMVGDAKPVAFVEDTAVATDRLPAFYQRFMEVVARRGAKAACYGHADVGCLHIRPILDVKSVEGIDSLRAIAEEISDLVLEFGGAMSGEHGDGLARSRWNEKLFGPELAAAFRTIKHAFDPDNRMNPGKIVASPDVADNLRLSPSYRATEPSATVLDFSNQGGFARAVEMCSGVGVCRKPTGGTMCPSYMITRDEMHSTRGRANALRLVMSGALPADGLHNETLHEALDLCLQCKACKAECPSNVDMAKLKAEVLYQNSRSRPLPIGNLLMGHIHRINAIGSATAPLANWTMRRPEFRRLMEIFGGIDRRRILPEFASENFRRWFRRHEPGTGTRGEVILLDDCFTTFNTPSVSQAAVKVLEAAGFRVRLAGLACCGRPAASKGLLDEARALAQENVAHLVGFARRGTPILGCEPGCLTMLVDEYRDFRLGPDADLVASVSQTVEAFIADRESVPDLPLSPLSRRVLLHGHCQQRAVFGTAGTKAALQRIPDLRVEELDSGCCGMAGSFGYELGHYELSEALANRVLIPAARADPAALLVAPGFSCRSQLKGLAGLIAEHPIETVAGCL